MFILILGLDSYVAPWLERRSKLTCDLVNKNRLTLTDNRSNETNYGYNIGSSCFSNHGVSLVCILYLLHYLCFSSVSSVFSAKTFLNPPLFVFKYIQNTNYNKNQFDSIKSVDWCWFSLYTTHVIALHPSKGNRLFFIKWMFQYIYIYIRKIYTCIISVHFRWKN